SFAQKAKACRVAKREPSPVPRLGLVQQCGSVDGAGASIWFVLSGSECGSRSPGIAHNVEHVRCRQQERLHHLALLVEGRRCDVLPQRRVKPISHHSHHSQPSQPTRPLFASPLLLVALCSATAMPCHASHASHAMHRTAGRPALAAINLVSRLAHSDSYSHSHSHSHPLSLQPRDPQRLRNCVRAFILTALSGPMQKGGGQPHYN
ncbi:uncharacterized protein K444DRAFT_697561, partial [Hyaloscypha bicolor E]